MKRLMKKSPAWNKVSSSLLNTRENLPFFIILLCFFTSLSSILLLQSSSFKFFLRLKAVTGSFWKIFLDALFIVKMFQCLPTTLLVFGRDRLYVNTSGIFTSFFLFLLTNPCLSYSQWWLKSFDVVQIRLVLSDWLHGIPSFSNLQWSESIWRKFWLSVLFR